MNFDLLSHTILVTIAGSRAYGLHTDTSDVDIKGVAIPPKRYMLGYLQKFEQADKPSQVAVFEQFMNPTEKDAIKREKLEGSIYNIQKFVALAADCNPNILDVLFCRDEEVRHTTKLGTRLRENRDLFISAKAKHTFSGYAAAQLKRIRGHRAWLLNPPKGKPTRADFGLPETTLIPGNQLAAARAVVQKQIDRWEIDWGSMADSEKVYVTGQVLQYLGEISAALGNPGDRAALQEALDTLQGVVGGNYESGPDVEYGAYQAIQIIEGALEKGGPGISEAKWLAGARTVGLDENLIYVMQKEREYEAAHQHWKQYQNWKKSRNPARAAMEAESGFDRKHGAHLVRLLRMGREILETGQVNVWRGDIDAEELQAIRAGAWSYEQLVEWADAEDKALQTLYKQRKYVVRNHPDRMALDNLCVELVSEFYDI